jgi:hypothetical protein
VNEYGQKKIMNCFRTGLKQLSTILEGNKKESDIILSLFNFLGCREHTVQQQDDNKQNHNGAKKKKKNNEGTGGESKMQQRDQKNVHSEANQKFNSRSINNGSNQNAQFVRRNYSNNSGTNQKVIPKPNNKGNGQNTQKPYVWKTGSKNDAANQKVNTKPNNKPRSQTTLDAIQQMTSHSNNDIQTPKTNQKGYRDRNRRRPNQTKPNISRNHENNQANKDPQRNAASTGSKPVANTE